MPAGGTPRETCAGASLVFQVMISDPTATERGSRCEAWDGMTRHVLIRADDGDRLVAESALPAEANLHDALAANPQLIPAADLGLGRTVVVGRESSLASGYADLILVDDMGQVCLVEVKKQGNPDTRQVIAQLFDYAASLWGQTLDQFRDAILRPYLRGRGDDDSVTLDDFISASFGDDAEADESEIVNAELVTRNLASTLERGTFALVVAAPQIPPGVERALEYLNAQGLRLYGLEVDYFRGQVECFVPRLRVMPPPTTRVRTSTATPVERQEFLESLGEHVSRVVAEALDAVEEVGARIEWNTYGATVKVALEQTRLVGAFDRSAVKVTIIPPSGFPADPFGRAKASLEQIGVGKAQADGVHYRVGYDEANPEQLEQVVDVLIDLARELTDRIEWRELPTPHEETITRNDYNVWVRHAPGLKEFRSSRLRARIARFARQCRNDGSPRADWRATLQGWKPQFR